MEDKARRLVTFLGTGEYKPTSYHFDEEQIHTDLVLHALAQNESYTEICVLATEGAEDKHGKLVRERLSGPQFPRPELIRIPDGKTPSEQWEQFEIIKRVLRAPEGMSVTLDITHGFRAQPFLSAAILTFLSSVDGRRDNLRVVYGAYDQEGSRVWDLTVFVELVNWSQALSKFLDTGRVEDVAESTEHLGRKLSRAWAESGRVGRQPSLVRLARALEDFGSDLETVRTGAMLLGDAKRPGSARRLLSALDATADEVGARIPPLFDVLERIRAMVLPLVWEGPGRLNCLEASRALAHLAGLYIRMGRFAEAAATVREGYVSHHASDEAARPGPEYDETARKVAEEAWQTRSGGRDRAIAEFRNDILHAGYRRFPITGEDLKCQLTRLADDFRKFVLELEVATEPNPATEAAD